MDDNPPELFRVAIPENLLSRGTGEDIKLKEACTLDFMPQLIGAQFQEDEALAATVYDGGTVRAPFGTLGTAYHELAWLELEHGNLSGALDAYKKALHNVVSFAQAIAALGDHALLYDSELDRLHINEQFGDIESALMGRIWAREVAFHPDDYREFVAAVRQQQKRKLQLNQLFFTGHSEAFEPVRVDTVKDHETGLMYLGLCLAMYDYAEASMIARELGRADEAELYERLAEEKSNENPRLTELIEKHMPLSYFD